MCDTFYVSGALTADGVPIFAKNSDRDPNEAHMILRVPAQDHAPGASLKCTYVSIPQVAHTHAVLLAKPFWIWGAEMGANEHGVVIGNEAVFSKIPAGREPGLIGMDYLRLGLERADTSRGALDVITGLLEVHGQSGNCGFDHPFYYHNSYIIADSREAWVLETAGQHWVALKIEDAYTISNRYAIGKTWDLASQDIETYARERGWCKKDDRFDFARSYADFLYSTFAYGKGRACRTRTLIEARQGRFTPGDAMQILRDHAREEDGVYNPGKGVLGASVCMHAGFGPIRVSQTTGSMVSVLRPGRSSHFFTATAAPCTSIFKPVWLDAGVPDAGTLPGGAFDENSLWWQHEILHRTTIQSFAENIAHYNTDRNVLERRFVSEALKISQAPSDERAAFSQACFREANAAEQTWLEHLRRAGNKNTLPWYARAAWNSHNRKAKMVI